MMQDCIIAKTTSNFLFINKNIFKENLFIVMSLLVFMKEFLNYPSRDLGGL